MPHILVLLLLLLTPFAFVAGLLFSIISIIVAWITAFGFVVIVLLNELSEYLKDLWRKL